MGSQDRPAEWDMGAGSFIQRPRDPAETLPVSKKCQVN